MSSAVTYASASAFACCLLISQIERCARHEVHLPSAALHDECLGSDFGVMMTIEPNRQGVSVIGASIPKRTALLPLIADAVSV